MMISNPPPTVAIPATAPAASAAPAASLPLPAAPATSAPTPPGPTPTASTPGPAPATPGPSADPGAPTAVEQLMATSAADALGKVDATLAKVAALTVGGGTPAGVASAKAAGALLTDASLFLQHAHVKAMEQLRSFASELSLQVMGSAAGLAFIGGQVATAGQSKVAVPLAGVIAEPAAATKATMAKVADVLDGANIAPAPSPVPGAPAETDARPAPPAVPAAPPAAPVPAGPATGD